jgi:tRNA(fMet)-specific endonuclease VapC
VKYLLDTDTFSFIAREASPELMDKVREIPPDALALSVISRGEIEFGLAANAPKRKTLERSMALLGLIATAPLPAAAAAQYRELRVYLQKKGSPIGGNDMWIAAHALAEQWTVVSNNDREFRRVPGLRVENWLR